MDKVAAELVQKIFGFVPSDQGDLARPLEEFIVDRKLEELAGPWGKAHDEITQIRAKYEALTDSVPADQALEEHKRIVILGAMRVGAFNVWSQAYDVAASAKYQIRGDIRDYYWPKQ